MDFCDVKNS